jgi:chromatin assembly factor 1 subunit B
MSSTDGFCSTLAFAPGELGQIYTGQHPTLHHHPSISTTSLTAPSSSNNTPVPTPTTATSPSLTKASPVIPAPSHPSPAPTFSVRPGSPTRSNSQSSIATLASVQTSSHGNNPTPTLGHVPLVTATNSAPPVGLPMTTPPQTPMSMAGGHSATSSISGSVLGKRDISGTSESEEDNRVKKRRIAPTLVTTNDYGDPMLKEEKKAD